MTRNFVLTIDLAKTVSRYAALVAAERLTSVTAGRIIRGAVLPTHCKRLYEVS
jgi:hypothetical protein